MANVKKKNKDYQGGERCSDSGSGYFVSNSLAERCRSMRAWVTTEVTEHLQLILAALPPGSRSPRDWDAQMH